MSLRQQTKQGGGEGTEDTEAVEQKKPFLHGCDLSGY